jgi:hypothetical protein
MVAVRITYWLGIAATALPGCGTSSARPGAAADEIPESELRVGNGPMRTEPPIPAGDVMPPAPRWLWEAQPKLPEVKVPPARIDHLIGGDQ